MPTTGGRFGPGIFSALAALAGATIGGLTSFGISWLTQRTQLRHAHREAERVELKTLYQDFMTEASRLFVEAMRAKTDDIDDISGLVGLHAMIGRMRLVSDQPVIDAAMQAEGAIVEKSAGVPRDPARNASREVAAELLGVSYMCRFVARRAELPLIEESGEAVIDAFDTIMGSDQSQSNGYAAPRMPILRISHAG